MNENQILPAVGLTHGALVVLAAAMALAAGAHVPSVIAGGLAIGTFFGLLWGAVAAMARGDGPFWLTGLTTFKISGYVVLAVGLFGRVELDAVGFAVGVTCFVGAAVLVALWQGRHAWTTGSFGSKPSPS